MIGLLLQHPKLAKCADLLKIDKLEDLSSDDLVRIANAFDVEIVVSQEIREAVLALLKGQSIDSVSDLIKSPDSIQQLLTLAKDGYRGLLESHYAEQDQLLFLEVMGEDA